MSRSRLVLALCLFLVGPAIVAGWSAKPETGQQVAIWALLVTGPFFIGLATEPDRIPDELTVGTGRLTWLRSLLVPGGGRGLGLLLAALAWLLASAWAGHLWSRKNGSLFLDEDLTQLAIVCMYAWIYVALPSTVFAARERSRERTWALRVGIVLGVLLTWIVPAYSAWADRFFVPFFMVECVQRDGWITERCELEVVALVMTFALSFLIAARRVLQGLAEIVQSTHNGRNRRVRPT